MAAEKRPHSSTTYATDQRFLHSGRIDHGVLAEHIESLLGVPLLADDEVIGVLFVADRYARTYAPQQIALLDSLAAFAAVAMENARLFEESREALERERRANAEIQSAAEVHERLSTLLASGGELDDLTDVVARRARRARPGRRRRPSPAQLVRSGAVHPGPGAAPRVRALA